jgi:hypothetical protein
MTDEQLKDFMEYFKDELPDPEHYPHKVMWLMYFRITLTSLLV